MARDRLLLAGYEKETGERDMQAARRWEYFQRRPELNQKDYPDFNPDAALRLRKGVHSYLMKVGRRKEAGALMKCDLVDVEAVVAEHYQQEADHAEESH